MLPVQSEPAVFEDGTLREVTGSQKLQGDPHGAQAVSGVEGESDEWMKTLPRFDPPRYNPLSSASTGSRDEARLKVRLARLQMESQEKAKTGKHNYSTSWR